jgi:putative glutathione S-transferase
MKLMIDGVWHGDVATPGPELDARRAIHAGLFRGRVTPDPASAHPAAGGGRYHLFVSYACLFAHRTILARLFAGLERAVGMSVLHPTWNTPDGWVFGATAFSTPDLSGRGFTHLHQAYAASAPRYTGKVTVPVLWDRAAGRIVSNESRDIVRMLDGPLRRASGAGRGFDLCPEPLRADIDRLDDRIASELAGGVYAVGGARDQAEYDAAEGRLFAFLADLEDRLGDGRPFVHGAGPTTSDVLAFTPLVRFDPVYNPLFRATRRRLVDHPRLAAWARRFHDLPGVADTVRFDHILMHYHDGDWGVATRRGIVPALPAPDFRSAPPG